MWSKLKTLMLIALIYLMSVLVFTDTGGKTNSEIVEREWNRVSETVSEGFGGAINIIENDVIPFVDTQMGEIRNEDRSLLGVVADKVKEPFSEGLMTGKVEEDTFFSEEDKE